MFHTDIAWVLVIVLTLPTLYIVYSRMESIYGVFQPALQPSRNWQSPAPARARRRRRSCYPRTTACRGGAPPPRTCCSSSDTQRSANLEYAITIRAGNEPSRSLKLKWLLPPAHLRNYSHFAKQVFFDYTTLNLAKVCLKLWLLYYAIMKSCVI